MTTALRKISRATALGPPRLPPPRSVPPPAAPSVSRRRPPCSISRCCSACPPLPPLADPTGCTYGQAAGLLSWVLQGIEDAITNRADVISLSLGTLVDITTGDGAGPQSHLRPRHARRLYRRHHPHRRSRQRRLRPFEHTLRRAARSGPRRPCRRRIHQPCLRGKPRRQRNLCRRRGHSSLLFQFWRPTQRTCRTRRQLPRRPGRRPNPTHRLDSRCLFARQAVHPARPSI